MVRPVFFCVATVSAVFVQYLVSDIPQATQRWLDRRDEGLQAAIDGLFGQDVLFAVLDAATIPCLLEMLEEWGTPHQSLFSGIAAEETREYAPYLVELTGNSRALRKLLLPQDRLNGLRGSPGITFLSSNQGFEALRTHLRRFTKISDDLGKWYFFRFWDRQSAAPFWDAFPDDAAECWRRYRDVISSVGWFDGDQFHRCRVTQPLTEIRATQSLYNRYHPLFDAAEWDRFVGRTHIALEKDMPGAALDLTQTRNICAEAWRAGFHKERAIRTFAIAAILARQQGQDFGRLLHWAGTRYHDDVARANFMLEELTHG